MGTKSSERTATASYAANGITRAKVRGWGGESEVVEVDDTHEITLTAPVRWPGESWTAERVGGTVVFVTSLLDQPDKLLTTSIWDRRSPLVATLTVPKGKKVQVEQTSA